MKGAEAQRSLTRTICSQCTQPGLRARFQPAAALCRATFSTSSARREALENATESDPQSTTTPPPPPADSADKGPSLHKLRVVPTSAAYFSGKPSFTDHLLELQVLHRKYETLPILAPGEQPRVAWKRLPEFKAMSGAEPIKVAKYHLITRILTRLNRIHPALMPAEVTEIFQKYKRIIQPSENKAKPILVDPQGRARGVGRRKTSTAIAWVVEGDGQVLINGKTLSDMFGRLHDRESAIWALKATQRIDKYNIFAIVKGGGVTGQAEALTLAVAKALMVHEPALKPALRRAGCITRDPRKVERKKPGKIKARKMPAWVKR